MNGHTIRRPFTFSTYIHQILPSVVLSAASHRARTTPKSIPVDSSAMVPKVTPVSTEATVQAVREFVNKTVPPVNIDIASPSLPTPSSQSRLAIQEETSPEDPGPSTRRPANTPSLKSFSDLVRHFNDTILPTLHYATRLVESSITPAAQPAKLSRTRSQGSTSSRRLGKSPLVATSQLSYEWRESETTDDYCLFDLSVRNKRPNDGDTQTPIVIFVLSPWKYKLQDLEDLATARQLKKSSSRSSSKRGKITSLLTKIASHLTQVQSKHIIISTYNHWLFGRLESASGSTNQGTLHLTHPMSHDSRGGMIANEPGSSQQAGHQWPVTVLETSLYWIHQAIESLKPVPTAPRTTKTKTSSKKRAREEEEVESDTEDEAEVNTSLEQSIWSSLASVAVVDQPSASKRLKRTAKASFADMPAIQEEAAPVQPQANGLRRSTRQRSVVQMSTYWSSSGSLNERARPAPVETKPKRKAGSASAKTDSAKRKTSTKSDAKGKAKAMETGRPAASPQRPLAQRPHPPAAKAPEPSAKRSRKHAREEDLTDIDEAQPGPSKRPRVRPPPLNTAALKSPVRPRNEPTAVAASPIYVPSSPPPAAGPSRTNTRVTRSRSLVNNKGSSSRTLYLERIYVPGTGLAIAEADRWSNEGNLSERAEWGLQNDSYQTAVEDDDKEVEVYGDVPSPAAMAKLRSGSEEYDSGYGRSTSPYVPDKETLKRLAVVTNHVNDPKVMGSLLKRK